MMAAVAPTWWPIPMHFAAVIGTTAPTVPSLLIRAGSLCRHLTDHSGPGCVSKVDALNGPARNEHPRSRRPTVYDPTNYRAGRSSTGLSGDCRDIRIRHLHCLPVLAADLVMVSWPREPNGTIVSRFQFLGSLKLVRHVRYAPNSGQIVAVPRMSALYHKQTHALQHEQRKERPPRGGLSEIRSGVLIRLR